MACSPRSQVMIPDVQKLINQSGNVSVDIFNTRLIKPPTSVLVFPLKVKQHIFGVVFCMSSVATDFNDVSTRLRELCEVVSPHLLALLRGPLAEEYTALQVRALIYEGAECSAHIRLLEGGKAEDAMRRPMWSPPTCCVAASAVGRA